MADQKTEITEEIDKALEECLKRIIQLESEVETLKAQNQVYADIVNNLKWKSTWGIR